MNGNTEGSKKKEKTSGADSAIREGLLLGMQVSDLIFWSSSSRKISNQKNETLFSYHVVPNRLTRRETTQNEESTSSFSSSPSDTVFQARLQVEAAKGNAESEKALSNVKKLTEADKDEVVTVKDTQRAVL